MLRYINLICFLATCLCCENSTFSPNNDSTLDCDVLAQLDLGWVCGRIRSAEENVKYASFKGLPYAQQPLGELRFKELQPLDPWDDILVATEEGPICPQYDQLNGRMARSVGMSESCILANVHVPLNVTDLGSNTCQNPSLPILVFIHGGGFQAGSGNSDMHGPEYLVSKGVIVITFNYRINLFGYLSLNSTKIPGNNGLRDAITLLKWVQRNARAFGGDPDNVTLAGQSAGSVEAHLVSLSKASEGLFKRVMLLSGVGNAGFYTTSPAYAATVRQMYFELVGINSTDADDIHDQLVQMPLEKIMDANRVLQLKTGVLSFVPVIESDFPGVTRIIDDYPVNLIKKGRAKDLPMIVGFTTVECEYFKRRIMYLDLVDLIQEDPALILPPNITYSVSTSNALNLSDIIMDRYFGESVTVDKYISWCTNSFFTYPAFKLAEWRASLVQAPTYVYQWAFDSDFNTIKNGMMLEYEGGGAHVEDMTFMFRTNSVMHPEQKSFPPTNRDNLMKHWMTTFVVNFMKCSHPRCDNPAAWPAVDAELLNYQLIREPILIDNNINMTETQRDMFNFHDDLFTMASTLT